MWDHFIIDGDSAALFRGSMGQLMLILLIHWSMASLSGCKVVLFYCQAYFQEGQYGNGLNCLFRCHPFGIGAVDPVRWVAFGVHRLYFFLFFLDVFVPGLVVKLSILPKNKNKKVQMVFVRLKKFHLKVQRALRFQKKILVNDTMKSKQCYTKSNFIVYIPIHVQVQIIQLR